MLGRSRTVELMCALVLVPACFHPNYQQLRCGLNHECPAPLMCNAQEECVAATEVPDGGFEAPPDVPSDAQTCFGTGLVRICLQQAPTTSLLIEGQTLNTDTSAMCAAIVSGGSYCVLAATAIRVDATLRATGSKPLVLVASDSITTTATIDVGSHRGGVPEAGAGANAAACAAATLPVGGGGGAGGSFAGVGGGGGTSVGSGGIAGAAAASITELRGGCRGQDGQGSDPGRGGQGGGALFLIAGNRIDVGGAINAAGEGGGGGGGNASGAGGGGSGGMIGLDARTVTGTGQLLATGGGGGEGSDSLAPSIGAPGSDPTTTAAAPGGSGNTARSGDGGRGAVAAGVPGGTGGAGDATGANHGGGGGGGGGAGVIMAPASASLGSQVAPPATP